MKLTGLLCLIQLIVVIDGSDDILILTDDNVDALLIEHELALVNFYTAKCPECDELELELERSAKVLKHSSPHLVFAQVNCYLDGKETCKKHGISNFPDLKVFRHGEKAFDYNGPKDHDGMVEYVRKNVQHISTALRSVDAVETFLNHPEYSILGFFERRDSVIFERYEMFATTLNEHFRFGHTLSEEAVEHYGYKNTFLIFRPRWMQSKLEPDRLEYDGVHTPHKMRDWVLANVFGLVGYRTGNTVRFFSSLPSVIVYYDIDLVKNAKSANYWRNRVLKVAEKFKENNVTFAISNAGDFQQELREHGVHASATQPVVIGHGQTGQSYVMHADFSVEGLEDFARQLLMGALTHKDISQTEDRGSFVKVVDAETFDQIINDATKDVLITFCTASSDHCSNVRAVYEELAYKLRREENIVIATMNVTTESVPAPYTIASYPSTYFAPMASKSAPKLYEGSQDVESLLHFLTGKSSQPVQVQNHDTSDGRAKTEL